MPCREYREFHGLAGMAEISRIHEGFTIQVIANFDCPAFQAVIRDKF
jgi:hypothetical protein